MLNHSLDVEVIFTIIANFEQRGSELITNQVCKSWYD